MKPNDLRFEWSRAYVEGSASLETVRRLEQALQEDEPFRSWFLDYLNLDLALSQRALYTPGEEEEEGEAKDVLQLPSSPRSAWRKAALFAAACCVIALGAMFWLASGQPFATVSSSLGIESMNTGKPLNRERVELKRGLLEMSTSRGVQVLIEAPAAFQFLTPQKLHLEYGRLAAEVPENATGFTVVTPTGNAIDLGTKFGVDVPIKGEAEIHVFQGEVIAQPTSGKRQNLQGGEGFSLHSEASRSRVFRSAAFIQSDEMPSLHAAFNGGQSVKSEAMLEKLAKDPALIVLLDFERAEALPEGAYRTVQGRWPGSSAPEFVKIHDHMELDVGGDHEWPQLTLAAWVRLDRFGAPYQSLLHTDGWNNNNFGQIHWMVTKLNTMRLALYGNTLAPGSDERDYYPDSKTSIFSEKGRWVHLATVYDAPKRTVRFFLNGLFDKETRQAIAYPARLGPAQIGNWDRHDRKLSGRLDELVILGRAMKDEEVKALYDAGNPYGDVSQ